MAVPLEAPLRYASGAHWGRFVRTIVEVETRDGIVGLGELGGGGQSVQAVVEAIRAGAAEAVEVVRRVRPAAAVSDA